MGRDQRRSLVFAAAALVLSPSLRGQAKRFRIGFLVTSDEATARPQIEALLAGLHDRGYQVDRDLVLDFRYAAGQIQRLPALASELIQANPDVLVGAEPAVIALRGKTKTIPLVLLVSSDPVASGLAKSLARPGGNVTGLANQFDQVVAKQVELLLEIDPRISCIALLNYGPGSAESEARFRRFAEAAARARTVTLVSAVARDESTLRQAFADFEIAKATAVIVVPTPPALQARVSIIEHAMRLRLLAVSSLPPVWADAGGLLTYGANAVADYRYAAGFVDRILKGANPAEMPIEQPARQELTVNLKTARQLRITIPQSVMLRADRLIE